MNMILYSSLSFIAVLISALSGGCMVFFIKKPNENLYHILFSFTSGLLLSLSIVSLLLPSLNILKNNFDLIKILAGILISSSFLFFINILTNKKNKNPLFIFLISLAIHNILEGFSLGLNHLINKEIIDNNYFTSIIFSISLFLSNLPESFLLSLNLKKENLKNAKIILINLIINILETISAFITFFFLKYDVKIIPFLYSLSFGFLFYILFEEVIPSFKDKKTYGIFIFIIGFCIVLFLYYFNF